MKSTKKVLCDMKGIRRGFTLIELLVVIAIIGILSSVVLVSLNSARNKGQDAKIQAQMGQIRTAAEIYYGGTGANTYGSAQTVCTAGMFADTGSGMSANLAAISTAKDCGSTSTTYSVAATLVTTGGYWCLDSTGVSRGTQAGGAAYTALTGAATAAHTAAGATTCN